jgi:malate synthase
MIEQEALPGTGIAPDAFWSALSSLLHELGPRNRALLAERDALQAKIDAWHAERRGQPHDAAGYAAFLREIGYLLPEGPTSRSRPTRSIPRSRASRGRSWSCRSPTRATR